MAVLISSLTKEQITLYGELSNAKSFSETPYLNLFEISLTPSFTNKIEFNMKISKTKMAQLKLKGGSGIRILNDSWIICTINPGEIGASINISADDLRQMRSGEVEVLMNGVPVKVMASITQDKARMLKDSITAKQNKMCAELINNGVVTFDDGVNKYDFGIPAAVAKTWSSSIDITKIFHEIFRAYRKSNGKMPTDVKIGYELAEALLTDENFQRARKVYETNIAMLGSDENAIIMGVMLGQVIKELDVAVDERGNEIMGAWDIKLIDKSALVKGYAGIEIIENGTNMPNILQSDMFVDLDIPNKIDAKVQMFAKSGFVPMITNPASLVTYTVTKS